MIIPNGASLKSAVRAALEELNLHFAGSTEFQDLGDGGAAVTINNLSLRDSPYEQPDTWCGFTVTFAHPYADIYPHFVRPDLTRRDKGPFGPAINVGRDFYGRSAIMLSRRVKHAEPELTVNPIIKLEKVMSWLITR